MKTPIFLFVFLLLGCPSLTRPAPEDTQSAPSTTSSSGDGSSNVCSSLSDNEFGVSVEPNGFSFLSVTPSTVSVVNETDEDTKVFFAFGANSAVLPSSPGWSFCHGSGLTCSFSLTKHTTHDLPLAGQWLNATISFDKPVTCETTKAEVNINNPNWFDELDVSLVDGFNRLIAIHVVGPSAPGQGGVPADAGEVTLGPPHGISDNENVVGVFPNGCDVCTARQSPPCGRTPSTSGCKSGTQYNPAVVCQWQGATLSGGDQVTVRLLEGVPLK